MTLFGKILVVLNLMLSIVMVSVAFALYTHRLDWSSKGGGDKVQGVVTALNNKIKNTWLDLAAAEARWKTSSVTLARFEQQRPKNAKWFSDELKALEVGPDDIRQVVFNNGQVVLDQQPQNFGLPTLENAKDSLGQPLKFRTFYLTQLKGLDEAIKMQMDSLNKLIQEDTELTARLTGDPDKGLKGLYQRIVDEKDKQDRIDEEQKFLEPLLINSLVEGELLIKRRESLDSRIKELEALGVASNR